MLKKALVTLTLPLLSILVISAGNDKARPTQVTSHAPTGTLQKMIVENGSVSMDLDLNAFDGTGSLVARPVTLHFVVGANSFFPILVFNDLLRGTEPGSMALVPVDKAVPPATTSVLEATRLPLQSLVVEKLAPNQRYGLAVRDSNTGFTFFNVEGGEYNYDAAAQSLSITGARLLISKEFANALGRPTDAGTIVGKISVGAAMQAIEIERLVSGRLQSASLPAGGTVPGPDVIVGDVFGLEQSEGGSANGLVGLALGTDACNKGTVDVDWFELPSNDHPFIPQNFYRMSGGTDNTQRFEQIGQSWGKHAFFAASADDCGFGCNGVFGDQLGSGCSDAYGPGLNGDQFGIGSRAWVNPFTGNFPSGNTSDDHTGHNHDVTSHRILVNVGDLNAAMNSGATYFAEAEYIVPHEGTWCQSHPDQCNMYNNASYKQYSVSGGPSTFTFSPIGNTVREQPAIMAWTGATVVRVEPDPGNDGIFFVGYKVTGPNDGIWHYEYAIYNQNLDSAIQSFQLDSGANPPATITNIGFHAPPQHPGFAQDGTVGDAGYSSTPWEAVDFFGNVSWSTETFAQNPNANAIRFGTLYNFRFDANEPPAFHSAAIILFKTNSQVLVQVPTPFVSDVSPTPPPPTPTPTPRPIPPPRERPTPHPRP